MSGTNSAGNNHMTRRANRHQLARIGLLLAAWAMTAALFQKPLPSTSGRPLGVIRLTGRAFVDDRGSFLGMGATLFWAGWAYTNDRERLERNLRFLADHGVDYIRVLGVAGAPGDSWSDRVIDPRTDRYDAAIAGLTDLAYDKFGLRVEWTIFGGVTSTPTPAAREDVVRRFVAMARGRAHKIQYFEVANEGWQNGFGGRDGIEELRALGQILRDHTPNLVALTSPVDSASLHALYDGSAANLLTMHLTRGDSKVWGAWEAVRDPWQVQFDWRGAWSSDEPIGPQSSVDQEDDPLRLAMGAAVAWLSGAATYVLHTGAGVRGGGAADRALGRAANVWETPRIEAILNGLSTVRRLLPADLPNFDRHNSNRNFPRYPFDVDLLLPHHAAERLLRAYAAISGDGRFVVMPLAARTPIPLRARQAMSFEVRNPLTAAVRAKVTLEAGDTYTLPPGEAYLIVGNLKATSAGPPAGP